MQQTERYSTSVDVYDREQRRKPVKLATHYICFKIVLLIANLIFMIFGIALISVGSYALNNQASTLAGQTLPTGVIVMGAFTLILSALGAFSTLKESVLGLGLYLVLLVLITFVLFAIGVAVMVLKSRSGELIVDAWMAAPMDVKRSVQYGLDCCGLRFWNDSAVWPCPTHKGPAGPNQTETTTAAWCYPQLRAGMDSAYAHAGGTGIAFSIIMCTAIFLVGCLISGVRQRQAKERAEQAKPANARAMAMAKAKGGRHTAGVDLEMDSAGRDAASMFDPAPSSQQIQEEEEELPVEYDEDGNPVEYQ